MKLDLKGSSSPSTALTQLITPGNASAMSPYLKAVLSGKSKLGETSQTDTSLSGPYHDFKIVTQNNNVENSSGDSVQYE